MKKRLTILLTAILLLAGCSQKTEPLTESVVMTTLKNYETDFNVEESGEYTINLVMDGQVNANALTDSEEEFEDIYMKMASSIQVINEPHLEFFVDSTIESNMDDIDPEDEKQTVYFKADGDILSAYHYDYETKSWDKEEEISLTEIMESDEWFSSYNTMIKSILTDVEELEINPETVMIDSEPTTEVTISFNEFMRNSLKDNLDEDQSMTFLFLGDDFISLTMNISNDEKYIKRLRLDLNGDTALLKMMGFDINELYFEMIQDSGTLTNINSAVGLPE